MIICEKRFDFPHPSNPDYSLLELDFYAWVPVHKRNSIGDHRLSLRKNLKTGKFELYRHYYSSDKEEEIIFEGTFEEALKIANEEVKRYHGYDREEDKPCLHTPPQMDNKCPVVFEAKKK